MIVPENNTSLLCGKMSLYMDVAMGEVVLATGKGGPDGLQKAGRITIFSY